MCTCSFYARNENTRKRLVGLHVKFIAVRPKPHLEFPPS